MEKLNIGIIGCGIISKIYATNLSQRFEGVRLAAFADLDLEKARARAEAYPGTRVLEVDALLADPEIDIVVNLTVPAAHFTVAKRALEAGKSVYNEKPLTLKREEGKTLLALAAEKGLRVGCAPDTFMGAGLQTCRKLIADGVIGEPVGAQAFMLSRGVEEWHANPEFYYKPGGGPVFDMGPYYITALVALLGPVRRAFGVARKSFDTRLIRSEPYRGQVIDVEIPTHVLSTLEFAGGVPATFAASFDVWGSQVPRIEIFGSEASLSVPDPNHFGGPVLLRRARTKEWEEVSLVPGFAENSRGLGVAEMADAIRAGRRHCADGALAYHVLDVMHAIHDAAAAERWAELESRCEAPGEVPVKL